ELCGLAPRRDRGGDRARARARGRLPAGRRGRSRARGRIDRCAAVGVAMGTAVTTASTVGYAGAGEQSRARYPDAWGHAERDGQRLYFEVYGDGDETLFLLPPWSIVHSRHWKMQIQIGRAHV